MSANLQDLWIFSKNGLPLVDFSEEDAPNPAILGALFSSIQTFCNEVSGTDLQSFIMHDCKFSLLSALEGHVIIVCKTESIQKEKKIKKFFNVIVKIFEETFTIKDIITWNGDSSFFDDFRNKLNLYFKMCEM